MTRETTTSAFNRGGRGLRAVQQASFATHTTSATCTSAFASTVLLTIVAVTVIAIVSAGGVINLARGNILDGVSVTVLV